MSLEDYGWDGTWAEKLGQARIIEVFPLVSFLNIAANTRSILERLISLQKQPEDSIMLPSSKPNCLLSGIGW